MQLMHFMGITIKLNCCSIIVFKSLTLLEGELEIRDHALPDTVRPQVSST